MRIVESKDGRHKTTIFHNRYGDRPRPAFKEPPIGAELVGCFRQAGIICIGIDCRSRMKGRRRDTPIPPAPDQGVGAIRRCGDLILPGRRDATVFHKFAWVDCEKSASRKGIKRGRGVSSYSLVLGTLNLEAVLRPCRVPPKYKRDITRTDNIYTQIKQPLSRVPSLRIGIKSCLPFICYVRRLCRAIQLQN